LIPRVNPTPGVTSNIRPDTSPSLKLKVKVRPRGCTEENSTADKDKDRDTDKATDKGMGMVEGMIKVKVKRGTDMRRGIIRREVGLVIWIWERKVKHKDRGLRIVSRARFT
jgi:hypothetical protein